MRPAVVVAVLFVGSFPGAAAPAQPAGGVVPVARTASETRVALAGTELLMGHSSRRGVRLLSAPAAGGAAGSLFSRAPDKRRLLFMNDLDASAERVVFSVVDVNPATEGIAGSSVWAGPPQGPFARLVRRRGNAWIAVDVQASGSDVAFTEIRPVGDVARHLLFPLGAGALRLPVPRDIQHIELAGGLVAFVDKRRLTVREWAGGIQRLVHTAGGVVGGFDLSADGRVLLHVPFRKALEFVSPTGEVTRVDTGGWAADPDVRLAGGHALLRLSGRFEGDSHVAVIDLATGQRRRLSPPSSDLGQEDVTLDAEGDIAAWNANGCAFAAPLAGPGSSLVPPGPCPRAEILLEDKQPERLQGRTVRIRLRCITAPGPGCRGTIRLELPEPLGKARYLIPAGRRETVRVRLTERGLAVLEREGELPPPGRGVLAGVRVTLAGGANPRSVTPHRAIFIRP
jgi:hypothetical protein